MDLKLYSRYRNSAGQRVKTALNIKNIPYEYIDIFEKLRELKDSGCDIYYILGNHDYWDFGFFNKIFTKHTFKDEYIILDKDKKILAKRIDYKQISKVIRRLEEVEK